MNKSYSKIRHIEKSNTLLESRIILSEQVAETNDTKPKMVINKVATEGIKNVIPQMISSPQFKGSYIGYQFGGNFNNVNYQWDCNDVEGMLGVRGMVDGEIITETGENMLKAINKSATDAKPGSVSVGFYASSSKFIIYTNTSNKVICINF